MKKKNTEWKWATESLASGVGVGGRVTALEFIIKISSECLPFGAVSSCCELVVERI